MGTTVEAKLKLMQEVLPEPGTTERWRDLLCHSADEELYRINAYEAADRWQIADRVALTEFIQATRLGLVTLHWGVVCGLCHTAHPHDHLRTVTSRQTCAGCGATFAVALDRSVEVSFTVHPAVRRLPTAPVTRKAKATKRVVTGLDCANLPAFRDFFADDVLSHHESLEVRDATILFTDIKGSTSLYNRLGDARAYRIVRDHFDLLFAAVAAHDGAVVKTIGDAVMASFAAPAQALRAALEAQKSFTDFRPLQPDSGEPVVVKIGLHRGPCLAVTLNRRLDFFGSTVNLAARTQQQATTGDLLMTEAMYEDPDVRRTLDEAGKAVAPQRVSLRGFAEPFVLYRVAASEGQEAAKTRSIWRSLLAAFQP